MITIYLSYEDNSNPKELERARKDLTNVTKIEGMTKAETICSSDLRKWTSKLKGPLLTYSLQICLAPTLFSLVVSVQTISYAISFMAY